MSPIIKNAKEDLISIAKLADVAANRDDIFIAIYENGMSTELAFRLMEIVRKGNLKGDMFEKYQEILKQYNLPDWYVKSLEKIRYLLPKAHSVAHVIMAYRLAWYKVNYLNEFKEVMQ